VQSDYPPELVKEALSYSQETIDKCDWLTKAILEDIRRAE
jgi:hypothetical protein